MSVTYERRPANLPVMKEEASTSGSAREEPSKPKVPGIPSHVAREELTNPKRPAPRLTLENEAPKPSPIKRVASTPCPPVKMLDVMPGSYPPKNFPDRIATYNNQGTPPFADGGKIDTTKG